MNRFIMSAGIACLIVVGVLAADSPPAKGDPRAAALLQEAAKTRYTWSPDVTAVAGKFVWEKDGKNGAGTFRSVLRQRGVLTVSSQGDGEVPSEVKDHIGSLISHRTPAAPGAKERPPAPSAIVVEDEEHGPLILTIGDPMQSTVRVKDGKTVQVNRLMGGKRFTIDVTEFEKSPDGRYYTSAFTVTWWDAATGKKMEKEAYSTQGFDVIDGQMFPKAEKVSSDKGGTSSTLALKYSEVKFEMAPARSAGK
jgi:hypothetical protein